MISKRDHITYLDRFSFRCCASQVINDITAKSFTFHVLTLYREDISCQFSFFVVCNDGEERSFIYLFIATSHCKRRVHIEFHVTLATSCIIFSPLASTNNISTNREQVRADSFPTRDELIVVTVSCS